MLRMRLDRGARKFKGKVSAVFLAFFSISYIRGEPEDTA